MAACGTNSAYTMGCRCEPCREAHRVYFAQWRERNRERARETARAWKERNRDHVRTYHRTYQRTRANKAQTTPAISTVQKPAASTPQSAADIVSELRARYLDRQEASA